MQPFKLTRDFISDTQYEGLNVPQLIGELPKPRMLIINPGNDGIAAIDIEKLAPTIKFVNSSELLEIRQLDWDAAIVFGDAPSLADHLYVVQLGGDWGGRISVAASGAHQLKIINRSRSVQFVIPDDLSEVVRPLMQSLVDLAQSRSPNPVMWGGMQSFSNESQPNIAQPFLIDADNYILAGCYLRPESSAEWWWLPLGWNSLSGGWRQP